MQATSWTTSDAVASATSGAASGEPTHGAVPRHQLGWYLAFALLTTLAEALFLLSSMPSWMFGLA